MRNITGQFNAARVCIPSRLAANGYVSTLCSLLAVVLFLVCCVATAAEPKAACTFDDHGLATLSSGDTQFLKSGALRISNVFFSDDKGADVAADKSNPTISFEHTAQRLSYSWPWGAVRCRYQLAGNRLNIDLAIENDTAGPMSGIELDLLELQFPRRPSGTPWEKRFQMISDNDGDITAAVADYKTGVLTFCNDDPASAVRAGFSPGAAPPQETWTVRVTSPVRSRDQPKIFVGPRSAKTFHFSLRFSEPGVPLKDIAGDIIEKFAAAHPFQLKWPDRRPIGMLSLASSAHSSPTNPRGWFDAPNDNFIGKSGFKSFREKAFDVAEPQHCHPQEHGRAGNDLLGHGGRGIPHHQLCRRSAPDRPARPGDGSRRARVLRPFSQSRPAHRRLHPPLAHLRRLGRQIEMAARPHGLRCRRGDEPENHLRQKAPRLPALLRGYRRALFLQARWQRGFTAARRRRLQASRRCASRCAHHPGNSPARVLELHRTVSGVTPALLRQPSGHRSAGA